MKNFQVLLIISIVSLAQSQSDGNFWWLNKNVVKNASVSRSLKEQNAKIRTLPPRFRKESDEKTTTAVNSIFIDEDEEDRKMYKYDDEPDCVCTPKYLCNVNNTIITDGAGILDERSFSICGTDNVCCRIPKTTTEASTTTTPRAVISTTTKKSLFNFNLNNVTNYISTILKPVPTTNFDVKPVHKCVSRKGKKIEKRILIDDDYDDGDESLVGETAFAEYPWMIEILKKNRKTGKLGYKCGGVLISQITALTANHCLKGTNINPSNFVVRAGEWDRSQTLEFAPHHDRSVSQITAHPQYYSGGLFNDIAILRWQQPIASDVNIAPICLPDEAEVIEVGTYCTVTGWGSVNDQAPTTDKLKFAKVPIVSRETCQRQFQNDRLGKRFSLHESFICAGGEFGIDSCTNDGGSPLICPRSDGSFVLAGLVSWGLECGQKDVPGAYTNIANLLKWIKSHEIKK